MYRRTSESRQRIFIHQYRESLHNFAPLRRPKRAMSDQRCASRYEGISQHLRNRFCERLFTSSHLATSSILQNVIQRQRVTSRVITIFPHIIKTSTSTGARTRIHHITIIFFFDVRGEQTYY